MNRNIFIGFFVVLLILVVSVVYVFNKPHRNVVDAKPQYSLSLDEMHDEFLADEEKAGQKYFDKVVELKGTLSAKYGRKWTLQLYFGGVRKDCQR